MCILKLCLVLLIFYAAEGWRILVAPSVLPSVQVNLFRQVNFFSIMRKLQRMICQDQEMITDAFWGQ